MDEQTRAPKPRRVASLKTPDDFRRHVADLGIELPLDEDLAVGEGAPLAQRWRLPDGRIIGNRFCIHPMEGWDCAADGRPTDLVRRRWRNFGLLWVGGALDDPRVFFCPSQRDPDLAWNTPYNPWPPSVKTCRRPDNPRIANHTESSFERRAGMTGVPWDRIGLRPVNANDIMWPETVAKTHRDGITAAYRDGHVAYVKDARFVDWWQNDSWVSDDSRLKFLEMSYWLDLQGRR